ncbi:MAG: Sir2 silent information regulator family NAD-dependent deacetylase, partial [Clostridia bacterium]|nr:Sir2 silent information regulator family NAD-dependent deacetylase [Clostridia bacterium]
MYELVKDKDYFVITTNVDHCFQKAGFDKKRLFYTQGDYGLFQCSVPCHDKTYNNEELIRCMVAEQKDMKIPSELVPRCPVCGKPMSMNLRADDTFVQDEGWYAACERYEAFIEKHKNSKILCLELGVGGNTPVIIKYPFWRFTNQNPKAIYACLNYGESFCPPQIEKRSICINEDIGAVLTAI